MNPNRTLVKSQFLLVTITNLPIYLGSATLYSHLATGQYPWSGSLPAVGYPIHKWALVQLWFFTNDSWDDSPSTTITPHFMSP